MSPEFTVLVITYNRPGYLRQLVGSLRAQEGNVDHELVVIDNGSEPDNASAIEAILEESTCPTQLKRYERNLHSASRWAEGAEISGGTFLLTPGDDDVLRPGYLAAMQRMAHAVPSATVLSGAVAYIDADGRTIGEQFLPTDERRQEVLLARLLEHPVFPMPSSGVRRTTVDFRKAPRARTTIDWWMWMQCVYAGPVASTSEVLVDYRRHAGQAARWYNPQANVYEAVGMLTRELGGEGFRAVLGSWSESQVERFTETLLNGAGPIYGDPDFGALVQMAAADAMAEFGYAVSAQRLAAQAFAQAGICPTPKYLQTLTSDDSVDRLPESTWTRAAVEFRWSGQCPHVEDWRHFLGVVQSTRAKSAVVDFRCDCASGSDSGVQAVVYGGPEDPGRRLRLGSRPTEDDAALLFSSLDEVAGARTLDPRTPAERKVMAAYRRFRWSHAGRVAQRVYQRARRSQ